METSLLKAQFTIPFWCWFLLGFPLTMSSSPLWSSSSPHSPENCDCSMLDQLSRFTILKLSFKESMLEHQSGGKAIKGR